MSWDASKELAFSVQWSDVQEIADSIRWFIICPLWYLCLLFSRGNPDFESSSDSDNSSCCIYFKNVESEDEEESALESLRNFMKAEMSIHFHSAPQFDDTAITYTYEANIKIDRPLSFDGPDSGSDSDENWFMII